LKDRGNTCHLVAEVILLSKVVQEYQLFSAAQWQQDPLLRPDPKKLL
jgi:hypothetical protein